MANDPKYPSNEFWDLLGPLTVTEREEIEQYMASGRYEPDMRVWHDTETAKHLAIESDLIQRIITSHKHLVAEFERDESRSLDSCRNDEERERIRNSYADLREKSEKSHQKSLARMQELTVARKVRMTRSGPPKQTPEH